MKIKKTLATLILANSLVMPSYPQTDFEEHLTEGIIEKISEELLPCPEIEKIESREINSRCSPFIFWPTYTSEFVFPEIKIFKIGNSLNPSEKANGLEFVRTEIPIVVNIQKKNKISLGITTLNSDALSAKNTKIFYLPDNLTHQEPIRINQSETKVYIFHQADLEVKCESQSAGYLSGKGEELIPLEESPLNKAVLAGGKNLLFLALKKLKVQDPEKYFNLFENSYKRREQQIMDKFAKEINPSYIATKIKLYPSRFFGDMEIGRGISLEISDTNKPYSIYIKPFFGDGETGMGSLEVLLNSSTLDSTNVPIRQNF